MLRLICSSMNSWWFGTNAADQFHNEHIDRDPELVKRIGAATALEVRATGIQYAFAPCIAVCRDPRWGRCYESYSEDHKVVQEMTDYFWIAGRNPIWFSIRSPLCWWKGFVISDWQGVDKITEPPHANYSHSLEVGINAGIDMVMVPYNYTEFIDSVVESVKNIRISMSRIDDAEHRDLAREAVRKSLVLLKNGKSADEPVLPFPKNASKIFVAGSHANNLGNQCGGWTIDWQGLGGNNRTASMLIVIPFDDLTRTTILSDILNVVDGGTEVTVVLEPYLSEMDALVAAWLPCTEGQGVADVLFGDYGFTGKLSRTWFKSVDQLQMNVGDAHYDPLFPFGFGLET
ncbi:hypothetical protein Syun_007339 [Stephania yunnanensis]|uniref:beta-glucosidase n=1 Tax=Stephania yunnanensis TaxID=152371 RepID=A0AAP0KZT4_9MAGN